MTVLEQEKSCTYADYRGWKDSPRCELIDGVPVLMSPAPGRAHQWISGKLFLKIGRFLEGKSCQIYSAPFDVRLDGLGDEDKNVVQPDLSVICDTEKLDDKGCNGAPDMIIEILSPSSQRHDRFVKLKLYQKAGVREYWIIDPETKLVQVHILNDGIYSFIIYGDDAKIPVHVLKGLEIPLTDIFEES